MLGGALSVVVAVVIASMPRGCIGDECALRPMRDTAAAGALLMLALLLIMVGAAGWSSAPETPVVLGFWARRARPSARSASRCR